MVYSIDEKQQTESEQMWPILIHKNVPLTGVLRLAEMDQTRCHFKLPQLIKLSVHTSALENVSVPSVSVYSLGAGKPAAQYPN